MILVDTSVLVDYFRTKDKKLLASMKANGGAVCGVIRADIQKVLPKLKLFKEPP